MSGTKGPRFGLTLKMFGASALVVAVVLGGTLAVVSARATRAADEALHSRLDNTVAVAARAIDAENAKLASGADVAAQIPDLHRGRGERRIELAPRSLDDVPRPARRQLHPHHRRERHPGGALRRAGQDRRPARRSPDRRGARGPPGDGIRQPGGSAALPRGGDTARAHGAGGAARRASDHRLPRGGSEDRHRFGDGVLRARLAQPAGRGREQRAPVGAARRRRRQRGGHGRRGATGISRRSSTGIVWSGATGSCRTPAARRRSAAISRSGRATPSWRRIAPRSAP